MSIALLKQHIEENGLSQKAVATQLGVSPTVVNQYLKDAYPGDVAGIDKKVVDLVARTAERKKQVQNQFVETATAKKMLSVCLSAHHTAGLYLIVGEAGIGKTMALQEFANKVPEAVLLEADSTFTPKAMLLELCDLLGTNTTARNTHATMKAVIDKLKGSDKVLLVDEAELLSYPALEILRRIHDKAGVGLVLAGMPRLRANLRGAKGEFKQLYSRIDSAPTLPETLPEADIHLLCESMLDTDAFNEQLAKASMGNARRLSKLIRGVHRTSLKRGEPINSEMIEWFAKTLVS